MRPDGGLVLLEREPAPDPDQTAHAPGRAQGLRTLGQRLMHENRYAEAIRLLDLATTRYIEDADEEERAGHDISARADLVSAVGCVTERAFCALGLSDYEALRRCLAESLGYRRRITALTPYPSADLIAGARQLPGSLETWRLRLDEDAERIAAVDAATPFYGLLAFFFLGYGAIEDALVASELARARAFADLLARSGQREPVTEATLGPSAPRFGRRLLREVLTGSRRTIVEYFVADGQLLIWVAGPDADIRYVIAPNDAVPRLLVAAERYRQIMTPPEDDKTPLDERALEEVLRELHQVLWTPVLPLLPPADPDDVVTIVPHGPALLIPFPGLRAPDGRYLIERHSIELIPALAMVPMLGEAQADRRQAEQAELLALVEPYPLPDNPETGEPFAPLTGMAAQFSPIARLYPSARVLSGKDASAANLPAGHQPRVLHFGTHAHAFEDKAHALDSFVALADGRLRARDVMGRRIPGDCVVLAACTTGRGEITGDGVIGLSRAFLAAGPTSLVLTLSPVSPDASLELMYRFHSRLSRDAGTPAQSLSAAQRELIADGEPVQDWSSFVLFGLG
jgi:CHAT domain-containing protein